MSPKAASAAPRGDPPGGRLEVAIVGCGLIGAKRARALRPDRDLLVGCHDVDEGAALALAKAHDCRASVTLRELLDLRPQVVIVATDHVSLAEIAERALRSGAHVLVEKPAGLDGAQVDRLIETQRACDRLVKVGFNHRFHPGLARAAAEVHSRIATASCCTFAPATGTADASATSASGAPIQRARAAASWSIRACTCSTSRTGSRPAAAALGAAAHAVLGHAGRGQRRADPRRRGTRAVAPGRCCTSAGPSGRTSSRSRSTAAPQSSRSMGSRGSYGPQTTADLSHGARAGPASAGGDRLPRRGPVSWQAEWEHFAAAITAADGRPLLGDLNDARYAWTQVEAAYATIADPSDWLMTAP